MTIPDTERSHTYRDTYTREQFIVEQDQPDSKYRKAIIEALNAHKFDSALEVGCAVGTLIGQIKKRFGVRSAGFDFSKPAIQEAKSRKLGVRFRVLDLEDMLTAYKPGQFDLILTSAVLQHCGQELFEKACQNILALKPKLILHLENQGEEKRVRANNKKLYCRHDYRKFYETHGVPAENIHITPVGLALIVVTL